MSRAQLHGGPPLMTALEAAEFLLFVASERNAQLDHRRLQDLMYYVQGITRLVLRRLLYAESIEARSDGPIVVSVENRYSRHGVGPIPVDSRSNPRDDGWYPGALLYATDREFMNLSTVELTECIMSERPWQEARATGLPIDEDAIGRQLDERIQTRRAQSGPKQTVRLREHMALHPELEDRLKHHSSFEEAIPLL